MAVDEKDNEGCLGFRINTPDGPEYDCEYEFAGNVICGDCIFGDPGGTQDPRVDPDAEEHEEDEEDS